MGHAPSHLHSLLKAYVTIQSLWFFNELYLALPNLHKAVWVDVIASPLMLEQAAKYNQSWGIPFYIQEAPEDWTL